ncbi:MAG: hypothetical protein ABIP61_04105, partial [Burkholderiaceae bacterium]
MPGGRFTRSMPRLARTAPLLWLMFVIAAVTIAARTTYVADLSAFLPSAPTPHQRVLLDQLKRGVAARLLLIGIEGGSAATRADASRGLAQSLRADAAFDAVHNGDSAPYAEGGRVLFEHRYLLSPAIDAQRFTVAGLRVGLADTLALPLPHPRPGRRARLGAPHPAADGARVLRPPARVGA